MAQQKDDRGIGIFGGTFNPIHLGHLLIAEKVREELDLKKIIFVPSYYPPYKKIPEIAAFHRYRMVKLAISGNPYFIVSKIELKRKGKSCTIDTVRELKKLYPKKQDLYLIFGLDIYLKIGIWKDIEKLARLIKFVVVKRSGYQLSRNKISSLPVNPYTKNFGRGVKFLNLGAIDISSTEIRKRLREGRSVRYFLPEKVINYIYQHHLYECN